MYNWHVIELYTPTPKPNSVRCLTPPPPLVALQGLFWAGGLIVVHYVNMYWEYWRYKMVYVGIVSLVFIFVYAAVPESPYW